MKALLNFCLPAVILGLNALNASAQNTSGAEGTDSLNKALPVTPALENNYYSQAVFLTQQGQFRDAISLFDKELELHPEHGNAYYNRGVAYYHLGDMMHACQDWKKTFALGDSSVLSQLNSLCGFDSTSHTNDKASSQHTFTPPGKMALQDSLKRAYAYPKHEIYFQASVLFPIGTYQEDFQVVNSETVETTITRSMEGEHGGFGAKQGYAAEIGEYFYYNQHVTQTAGGLKLTFASFTDNAFRWEVDSSYIFASAKYKDMYSLSFKAGPCLRHIMNKQFVLRIYYQLCLTANMRASWHYDNDIPQIYYATYDFHDYRLTYNNDHAFFESGTGTGVKHEFGAVITYRKLLFGLSVNTGNIKYNSVRFKRNTYLSVDEYYSSTGNYQHVETLTFGEDRSFKVKAPTTFATVSFGIAF